MLKIWIVLALLGVARAKLVGAEFVSPELAAKSRRQQQEAGSAGVGETMVALESPISKQEEISGPLTPEAAVPSLQEFLPTGVVVDGSGSTPELTEEQMTEIQMLLALRDIVRLEKYVESILSQLSQRIYGDLENTLLINKFTQSFQMYEMVLNVLQKYRLNKALIVSKVRYIVQVVDNATGYIRKTNDRFMEMIDSDDPPEVRMKNRMIFMKALENLNTEVKELSDAILQDFDESFKAMEDTHNHPLKSDLQKIHILVEACLNLVIFKKTTLKDKSQKVLNLRREVLENPQYNNHLKKIQDDRIIFSGAAGAISGLIGLAVTALMLAF
jgi:hypothetical protein